MSERNVSRPWTEYEDNLLRAAVATVGLGCKEDWKSVAAMVPNRDNKACRKVRVASEYLYISNISHSFFTTSVGSIH
jgi:hypothetical protein